MKITIISSMLMNTVFVMSKQPMYMIMMIIMQATMMTLILNKMTKSSWFPYLLMIIFIGGMMVLFIYITSIAPNEKTKISHNYMMISLLIIMMIIYNYENSTFLMNAETEMNMYINNYSNHQTMLNKVFNKPVYSISIMMMMYLFITLIVVNKICYIKSGPLRKKN